MPEHFLPTPRMAEMPKMPKHFPADADHLPAG